CADSNSKLLRASCGIRKPQRFPNVVGQKTNQQDAEIQKVAVNILHDQRKEALAQIGLARLPDCAGGRIGPERFVIRAAIVVAGESKKAWRPKNQERRRE